MGGCGKFHKSYQTGRLINGGGMVEISCNQLQVNLTLKKFEKLTASILDSRVVCNELMNLHQQNITSFTWE